MHALNGCIGHVKPDATAQDAGDKLPPEVVLSLM